MFTNSLGVLVRLYACCCYIFGWSRYPELSRNVIDRSNKKDRVIEYLYGELYPLYLYMHSEGRQYI